MSSAEKTILLHLLLKLAEELLLAEQPPLQEELSEPLLGPHLAEDLVELGAREDAVPVEHLSEPVVRMVAQRVLHRALLYRQHSVRVAVEDVHLAPPVGRGDDVDDLQHRHAGDQLAGHGHARSLGIGGLLVPVPAG